MKNLYIKPVTLAKGHFWPGGHTLNKLGRGPLCDSVYQILSFCQIEVCGFRQDFLCFPNLSQ